MKENSSYSVSPSNFSLYFIRKVGFSTLRSSAHQIQVASLGIRLNSWRVFLGIFPESGNINSWQTILQNSRERYKSLKSSFTLSDPLIDRNEILKLRSSISKDTVRTFQNLEFFTRPSVQNSIISVLSIWAASNSLGYLQGMSEIVSIIYYQVHSEQFSNNESILSVFNSPEEVESDTFQIFDRLFQVGLQKMYMRETQVRGRQVFGGLFEDLNQNYSAEDLRTNPVLSLCHEVFEVYLRAVDPELFTFLKAQNVESHLFLL
jgi:hypothetical protein